MGNEDQDEVDPAERTRTVLENSQRALDRSTALVDRIEGMHRSQIEAMQVFWEEMAELTGTPHGNEPVDDSD